MRREERDDAISRQWLMECVNEGWIKFDTEKDKNIFIHLIRDMAPPVTPQPKYEDIVKAFQFGLAFGSGEKHDETDKVIDEIKKVCTPQPKMGHCIEERTYMECPNCHDIWHYEENQTERFQFCPTCGKRIK